jgi:chitodextrinase
MLAPQNFEPNLGETMASASIMKWYSDMADAMALSEVQKGTYKYRAVPPSSGTSHVVEGGNTSFKFAAHRFQMISIDNSNIYLTQEIPIEVPIQEEIEFIKEWYVGYRDVGAIIKNYRIRSNTDEVQSVHNACYEWFLNDVSTNDPAKENNSTFAMLKKIRARNTEVPGEYINISGITTAAKKITVKLDNLRVPLSRFLVLRNLKWIADWMGTITIEIEPSYENIVVAPVIPEATFIKYPKIQEEVDLHNNNPVGVGIDNILVDFGFHQLDQVIRARFRINEATGAVTFMTPTAFKSYRTQSVFNLRLDLATFYLRENIANEIAAQYASVPLFIPINVVHWRDFVQAIGTSDNFTPAASASFKSCDAAYIVFKEDNVTSTQRFTNPCIRYQFNINGPYPDHPYETIYDAKHTNQTLDAFNINNSRAASISEDLRTSMQRFVKYTEYKSADTADSSGASRGTRNYHWSLGDQGRFFIGIPFCDSGIFQGGLNRGDTEVVLEGSRLASDKVPRKLAVQNYAQPVFITTSDRILLIRSTKPAEGKQWEVTTASFDELMGST